MKYSVILLIPRIVFATLLMLYTASSIAEAKYIPAACQTNCKIPYGQVLGQDKSGVPGYSNCNSDCFAFDPNRINGIFTGIKWQCVEYARRWLLVNKGIVYGDVDYAVDIWDMIDHYHNVLQNKEIPATNHVNGSETSPEPGDLLIYAREMFGGTGHVAIITEVDLQRGIIRVAEQNYRNQRWPGDYAREIQFIQRGRQYWLLDSYLIGWKHAEM